MQPQPQRYSRLLSEFRESRWAEPWVDRRPLLRAAAIAESHGRPDEERRARVFSAILCGLPAVVWGHELLLGSWAGIRLPSGEATPGLFESAAKVCADFGERNFSTHSDHGAVAFDLALQHGIGGLKALARERSTHFGAQAAAGQSRVSFLQSVNIALDGFARFVLGYASAAREAATLCGADPLRRQELQDMADICARVADLPPATFREALQLTWLIRLGLALEGRYAMAFGRLDQYLYPFYTADLAAGRLTADLAQELLNSFFAKFGECELALGQGDVVNVTIGGVTPGGEDGTNPLSYMCLKACAESRIPTSNLSARFHKGSPHDFYVESARVIRTGIGFPAVFNDDVLVDSLSRIDIPIEDARDYCFVGCIETFLQGKQAPWADGRFNLPKCLELAMTSGVDMLTGQESGAKTAPAEQLTTYALLLEAFWQQMDHALDGYVRVYDGLNRAAPPGSFASPFMSAVTRDCIESGRDINDGGARYPAYHGIAAMGLATVADSLAVTRKLAYGDGALSLPELVGILQRNWAGHEALRSKAELQPPKYGNDDPAVDDIAAEVAARFCSAVLERHTPSGGRYVPLIAANVSNVYAGAETGATADGRLAGQPLSDAASPAHGRDKLGPTAVIRSLTKVDYRNVVGGSVVNQKLNPEVLAGEAGLERLAALIKGFFSLGGQEMQFNVVTKEVLEAAQRQPSEYGDLLVRVSGFSAYFTGLTAQIQEDIILRTTQDL